MTTNYFKLLALLMLLFASRVSSESIKDESLLTKFCLAGFEAEMRNSGLIANKDVGKFTCDCFINKLNSGYNIERAKSNCRKESAQRFKL